jgi:signal transduction histidine kinase
MVHEMLDRARIFNSSQLQDERLLSLGRVAAGLAHELNNPASAVARSAKALLGELDQLEAASQPYCALRMTQAQANAVEALRAGLAGAGPRQWSPIQMSDREDAIGEWLDAQRLDRVDPRALAESAISLEQLKELAPVLGDALPAVLEQVTMDYSVRRLAGEIETAASRIHALVAAVRGFTYMDQTTVPKPVDLGQGIADTLTILKSKAKQKRVELGVTLAPSLPKIEAFGGELNQVWSNLVSNAIDAVPEGGRVDVTADAAGSNVTIKVADNGPGIDPKVLSRVFEPFVTTKDVGQGTGLGLDMARRIIRRHNGNISFTTGPQGTEFTVTLPVAFAGLAN